MAATTEEVPRPYGRGTSSVVSFVVAMNRVDVVELVVDLVDVDLDVGLVDVDLDVDLDVDFVDVDLVVVDLPCDRVTRQECSRLLSFEKCFKTSLSKCKMDLWSSSFSFVILTK